MITANLRVEPILLVADPSQMFYSIGYSTEPEAHIKVNNNRGLYRFYGATAKMTNQMFEEIGMKVTKYMSNSSKVLNSVSKDDLGPLMKNDESDENK